MRARLRAALAVLLLASAAAQAKIKVEKVTGVLAGGAAMEVVAQQAWVRFLSGTDKAAALAAGGFTLIQDMPGLGWTLVGWSSAAPVPTSLSVLRALPGVQAVDFHHVYHPSKVPNDPLVSAQTALSQVDAFAAWEYETGATARVTVAMIDAGIDGSHPEFAGKFGTLAGQFFNPDAVPQGLQSADNPPTPACNHATRTAGIVAASANNGAGIAGMSWGAQLLSLKIFNNADCNPAGDCPGTCITQDLSIVNAVNYAVTLQNTAAAGKVVINMSVGGSGACSGPVGAALNAAVAAGLPVVVSAGNDGGAVNTPANCATATGGSGIIPVGAVDNTNSVAYFSSRGPELAANGLVAPGVGVETTDLNSGYTSAATGTSFAAPHVAGLAALLLSQQGTAACSSAACAKGVQAKILGGADGVGGSSSATGSGRMDAFRTMRLAVNGTLAGYAGDVSAIAFPNPFKPAQNGAVTITIPPSLQGGSADIKVFTVRGELVRDLGGQLTWDGKNDSGNPVASGTYIFMVATDKGKTRGRLALVR